MDFGDDNKTSNMSLEELNDSLIIENFLKNDSADVDNEVEPGNTDGNENQEPNKDNSEQVSQNTSDDSTSEGTESANADELKDNSEPLMDDSTVIDDKFIEKYGKDYKPEFLERIKGKSFAEIVKSVNELETLKGRLGSENGELKKRLGLVQSNTIVQGVKDTELKNIDWNNKDSALQEIINLKMKQAYPEFESIEAINDMPLLTAGDSKKATDMLNTYERISREAETEYTQVSNDIRQAPAKNWETVVSLVDRDIKDYLELADVTFEDIGLSHDHIKVILNGLNPSFKLNEKFEDNLASLLLLDENGNVDKDLFAEDHLGVFRVNPLAINQKFVILTKDLIKDAKEAKKIQIQKAAENKGFESAIKNKPSNTLSNATSSGQNVAQDTTVNKMSLGELDDYLADIKTNLK